MSLPKNFQAADDDLQLEIWMLLLKLCNNSEEHIQLLLQRYKVLLVVNESAKNMSDFYNIDLLSNKEFENLFDNFLEELKIVIQT